MRRQTSTIVQQIFNKVVLKKYGRFDELICLQYKSATQVKLHRSYAAGYIKQKLTLSNVSVQVEIDQFFFKHASQFNNSPVVFFHSVAGA
jgi:hypothetical protein